MAIVTLPLRGLTTITLDDAARFGPSPALDAVPALRGARHVMIDSTMRGRVVAARIDAAIREADRAVMLVAHGTNCLVAAWWARLSPRDDVSRIAGALMLAPDDRQPVSGAFAAPRARLPFPSLVVGADDASQRLAAEWGSRLVDGPLPLERAGISRRLQSMVLRFTSAIVEQDVIVAERLVAAIGDG